MADTFTAYITAETLLDMLSAADARKESVALLRASHVSRVVLEGLRGSRCVPESILVSFRDFYEGEGFETLGGLMTVYGEAFGEPAVGVETRFASYCFSREKTVAGLEQEIRKLARCFKEVVIDDAFLTSCRCEVCEAWRGDRDWGAFRATFWPR